MDNLGAFRRSNAATTAIEFGLLAAVVATVVVGAASVLADDLGGVFDRLSGGLRPAVADCDKKNDVMRMCR
jgi:Flp pilus assembly pilin Flp